MSAPPKCCIAGADGQPWPSRSAWVVAFRRGSLDQPDAWAAQTAASSPKGKRRGVVSSVDLSPPRFRGQLAVRHADPKVMKLGSRALVYALNGVQRRLVCFVQAFGRGCDAQRYLNYESNPLGLAIHFPHRRSASSIGFQ